MHLETFHREYMGYGLAPHFDRTPSACEYLSLDEVFRGLPSQPAMRVVIVVIVKPEFDRHQQGAHIRQQYPLTERKTVLTQCEW